MTDAPELSIREAGLGDAEVIARFNLAMAQETEGRTLDEAVARRGVERALREDLGARYFLAERGGAIAGQMMITREWSDWRDGMFWWIQSVYVEPGHRRRGVFAGLYRHVEALARADLGVCGLRLYVEHRNAIARHTYEKLGMSGAGYDVFEVDFSSS